VMVKHNIDDGGTKSLDSAKKDCGFTKSI